jgi:hypothetical protein
MMRRIAIACFAMFLAGMAAPARADLVIYAQDNSLVPSGGYSYLNIYLAGSDSFDNYTVTLSITAKMGTLGTLVFAPNGSAPDPNNAFSSQQPYNYLSAGDYIFSGDSTDGIAGVNGGAPSPSGTSMTITDESLSGSEYTPMSDSPPTMADPGTLLASVLIYAITTNPGDQYQVGLVSASFTNMGSPVGSPTLGSTTGFTGLLGVTNSSVPEPASIVSGMTALVILVGFEGGRRLRRSRRVST